MQARNLAALQPRAWAAVERLQARQPELAAQLLSRLAECEAEGQVDASATLRAALER